MPDRAHALPEHDGATAGRRARSSPVGRRKDQLAAETLRLYAGDWARFAQYCASLGVRSLQADPATVAAFLHLPGPGRALRTRRLAAIDHRHRQHGSVPPGDDPQVRAALKQARAAAPERPRPPPPSPATLRGMAGRCGRDLAGVRDCALLLLLAEGLSRPALVRLQAEYLRFGEQGVALGAEPARISRSARHDLCPVRALEEWLRSSATRYGPVFRKVTRWGTVEPRALGADAVRLILARRGQ